MFPGAGEASAGASGRSLLHLFGGGNCLDNAEEKLWRG
jgi:hypothetical protein